MPSTSAKTATTSEAWSVFAMTTTGDPAPPGKCAESTFSPAIDGCSVVNDPSLVRPFALRATTPKPAMISTSDVTTQVRRGGGAGRGAAPGPKPGAGGAAAPRLAAPAPDNPRPPRAP